MAKLPTIKLQFSLRYLLLAMALLSLVLVVYRWPWTVEVGDNPLSRTTTQYRRGWYGVPVKDGPEVERLRDLTWERWFDAGDLRSERLLEHGVAILERRFRGGKLHGPYWGTGSQSRAEGEYHQDLQHGNWKYSSGELIVREEWQLGKRHGLRTWTTPEGRLLQSAEYDQGELVRWNDAPVETELVRWLDAASLNPELRERFLLPLHRAEEAQPLVYAYAGEVMYFPAPDRPFSVHWENVFPKYEQVRVGRPIGETILAKALENSSTLVCRFNCLYAVPITGRSLAWQDRTGVHTVRFEPFTQQAQAWLEPVQANYFPAYAAQRFQELFEPSTQTGITLDTAAIQDLSTELRVGDVVGTPPAALKFPRRDLLGTYLDKEGCYCEQQGNMLIIRRLQ